MFDFVDSVVLLVQAVICIMLMYVWKHQKSSVAYASSIAAWDTVEHKALTHTHAPVDMTNSLETRIIARGDPIPAQTLFTLYERLPKKKKIGKVVLRGDNVHAYDEEEDALMPEFTGPYLKLKAAIYKEYRKPWYVTNEAGGRVVGFKKVNPTYQDIMSGKDLRSLDAIESNA